MLGSLNQPYAMEFSGVPDDFMAVTVDVSCNRAPF